jgi:hypothetical protein
MRTRKEGVAVRRLDQNPYVISLDQIKEALAIEVVMSGLQPVMKDG